jgi:hypothetical protein
VIWVGDEVKYFLRGDWTTQITLNPLKKIKFARTQIFAKARELRMNPHRPLAFCLRMISAQTRFRVCREGKRLHSLR